MRQVHRESNGEFLAEGTVEGIHSCLCGILSDAVEAGYITHNPAWRAYKKKGITKERPVADEETVQRLIAALETQSMKYEVYYKLSSLPQECGGAKPALVGHRLAAAGTAYPQKRG